ncbi:MAG TPA: alpha/beta hydrolase [Ktedonobacterales bacterium]
MTLDPQLQAYAAQLAATAGPPRHTQTPEAVRAAMLEESAAQADSLKRETVASIERHEVSGPVGPVPVHVYIPEGQGPFPVVVYLHGGGWVLSDPQLVDSLSRSIAHGAGCVVVAVEYHLAPEHRFPVAVEDCYNATQWAAVHAETFSGDPARLAVAGDSAGGNLAAVVALMTRLRGGAPLHAQILIYPITDLRMQSASYTENAYAPMLTRDDMHWFRSHYIRDESDIENSLASPLLARDLQRLPPALIVTAGFDPLRDEGEQYAGRLRAEGISVTLRRYDDLAHGFLHHDAVVERARQGKEETIATIRAMAHAPASAGADLRIER